MSSPTAETRSPRFSAPAGFLLLTGVVTAYGFFSARSDDATLASPAVAQSAAMEEVEAAPAAPQLAQPRYSPRPRVHQAAGMNSAVFPDLATGLAALHAGAASTPVQSAERDRVVAELDHRYAAEAIDPVWSATQEEGLAQASESQVMAQAGFNPQDVSSECRSKSCRISARFDSPGEARDWAERLITQMAGTIGQARVAVLPQSDGRFEVRVYGARRS
jgi:hypothetical protein